MTVGSLFSGIGGLELGLEACGLGPVLWQAENDPHALAVLAHHWPSVKRYTDVRDVNASSARVDLVCGGFPCQPHSVAGKRRGTADARWLWPEFARIIGELKPSAVFIENVPGLRTSGLRNVLADLARLGFDAEWGCFKAAHAGAPHRRTRLFILAHADRDGFRQQHRRLSREGRKEETVSLVDGPTWVAPYANRQRRLQPGGGECVQWRWTRDGDRWAFESPVPGVAHGVSRRMDRHRLTGNAVVAQQAAHAFKALCQRVTA